MRESRLSGSVEGVMSDHDSYSDCVVGFCLLRSGTLLHKKTKPFLAVPGASPHALSRPRSLRLSERSEEP
jgi:hypothetical protein